MANSEIPKLLVNSPQGMVKGPRAFPGMMPATGVKVMACQCTRVLSHLAKYLWRDTDLPGRAGRLKAAAFCTQHWIFLEGSSMTFAHIVSIPI